MANEIMSLEELNRQFAEEQKEDDKKRKKGEILRVLLVIVVLIVVIVLVFMKGRAVGRTIAEAELETMVEETTAEEAPTEEEGVLPAVLSGQEKELTEEEIKKWTDIDKNDEKVYVDVERSVPIYGTRAYLNIVNPIYNSYAFSVRVISEDESEVYVEESMLLEPGMSLKAVELATVPERDCDAVVEVTFYEDDGEELGKHEVEITLEKQNK